MNEVDFWWSVVGTAPSLGCGRSRAALSLEQNPSFGKGGGLHGAIFVADIHRCGAGDITAKITTEMAVRGDIMITNDGVGGQGRRVLNPLAVRAAVVVLLLPDRLVGNRGDEVALVEA